MDGLKARGVPDAVPVPGIAAIQVGPVAGRGLPWPGEPLAVCPILAPVRT
jgi:hypothetical protein